MSKYEEQTQKFSTFGSKLLQHADVLSDVQKFGVWKPVTVQICPVAVCDSKCEFCSVANRDLSLRMTIEQIKEGLKQFKLLGAKAVEFTGGGNPLLFKHIKQAIDYAYEIGYDIGIISNSENPSKFLDQEHFEKITWYRSSLTKLEEGKTVADFNFDTIPKGKLGFSHIMNVRTTPETIKQIAELVERYPGVKFVRIAGNCLDGKKIEETEKRWGELIEESNVSKKFFIKNIGTNHRAYPNFCGVGPIRPYVGEDGFIYICSSHVLKYRKLHDDYRIGHISNVMLMYKKINQMFQATGKPYDIDISKCGECFYFNNNKLLHTISSGYKKWRDVDANFA